MEKFTKKSEIEEIIKYLVQRINMSRDDYDRGWLGSYNNKNGFEFMRKIRGVSEKILIDKDLLKSQLIENIQSKYSDVLQLFETPGELIGNNETISKIYSPSQLLEKIINNGKKGLSLQRYKGLGEMNPDQLWETTLNPNNRTLTKVEINDEADTKRIFEDLMGENVLPRKEFIESRAETVSNLDI